VSKIHKSRIKNKPVPQLKVLAVIIFILACFALDVATQANFFQSVLALKGIAPPTLQHSIAN